MIIFAPISILFAIATSPASLHILTANSDKNAIPVIFINNVKNSVFIDALLANDCNKFIIPVNLSTTINNINAPAIRLTYITNSGFYCFSITIIIKAIRPIPIIFNISIVIHPFLFFY